MLRKDEHWFVQDDPLPHGGYETWPVTRAELDPHYDAVEQMLNPTPYPLDTPGYSAPKTHALRDAAAELGLACQLPPLAVSFAPKPGAAPGIGLPIIDPDYGNLHGRPRTTCRLCGECDIGCNNGAKNSLDYNYLSAAKHHGADLRTGHEVKAIRPRPAGGYEVDYIQRDLQDPDAPIDPNAQPTRIITCDRLVLAAGTFGTSYLLLRNRPYLRQLSAAPAPGSAATATSRAPGQRQESPPHPPARRQPRTGDHDRYQAGRRARRPWRVGTRCLHRGRRLPCVRRLAGGSRARAGRLATAGPIGARAAPVDRGAGPPDRHLRRDLRAIGPDALVGQLDAAARHGPRHSRRDAVAARRPARPGLVDRHQRGVLRAGNGDHAPDRGRPGAHYVDNPMWLRKRIVTAHPVGGAPMGATAASGCAMRTQQRSAIRGGTSPTEP